MKSGKKTAMAKRKKTKAEYKRKLVDKFFTLLLLIIIFALFLYIGYSFNKEIQKTDQIVKEVKQQ
jgi:type VI protein secretion system component VasF